MKCRILTAAALLCVLVTLCACAKPLRTNAPMTGFCFSHSGTHTGLMYRLSADKTEEVWQATLSLLGGEREYVLDMTETEAEELAAIVRKQGMNRWNGFDKTDRRVLDGTGFDLTIRYADGQVLSASGSNAFPMGYREARDEILKFFGELMERNGWENPL